MPKVRSSKTVTKKYCACGAPLLILPVVGALSVEGVVTIAGLATPLIKKGYESIKNVYKKRFSRK